jgi:hypothetical protein
MMRTDSLTANRPALNSWLSALVLALLLCCPQSPLWPSANAREANSAAKDAKVAKRAVKDKPASNEALPVEEKKKQKAAPSQTNEPRTLSDAERQAMQQLPPTIRADLVRLAEQISFFDRSVANELQDDQENTIKDMSMLWQAAVERSSTIRYAIEKLSRKDATGKPLQNDSFTKKMVTNIARLGGAAGSLWTGSPVGLMSGALVSEAMQSDPMTASQIPITDADMVILAREVEALQNDVIRRYYGYRYAKERLALAHQATLQIAEYQKKSESLDPSLRQALEPLLDSLYESTRQQETSLQQQHGSARNALALLVGQEVLTALDQTMVVSSGKDQLLPGAVRTTSAP